ncbi:unnamed protein product [Parnassius apollo]|uniref:(apollo) hypothetical protein n=1 Tax=Parnassius apollo TaxID=110799 RepID=A0A8S3WGW4_PARAO|nr:unnamed protein product [Parnassius apollo]
MSGHSRTDFSKMPPLGAHQLPPIGAPPTPQTARRLPKHSLITSTLMLHRHLNATSRAQIRNDDPPQSHDDPSLTQEKVLECLKQMSPKKVPGLDNFTSDICLQLATDYPRLLTDILNRCLTLQHFHDQWKTTYSGFREQTSTCEAINTVLKIIKLAKSEKPLSIAISLDIKAAFDNAWWPALFHRLRHIQCPNNIFGLIQDYVRDPEVILDHARRRVTKTMSKGCIQGSTCGPVLWSIILDELLDARLPAGCHIQAFADDVLLVVTAASVGELESAANLALHHIVEWGRRVKLAFGPTKTKLIAFTPKANVASINMDGHRLSFVPEVKLLGVILEEKLNFGKHVKHVIKKAVRIFNTLCMYSRPTWGAHPENISTIYHQVIVPTITYAAGIWLHVAQKRALGSMQRGFAIKAIRGFRTSQDYSLF